MWNITFCCRGTKVGKDGLAPVEMVITVDGVRSYRRPSIKVNPLEYKKLITNKPFHLIYYHILCLRLQQTVVVLR